MRKRDYSRVLENKINKFMANCSNLEKDIDNYNKRKNIIELEKKKNEIDKILSELTVEEEITKDYQRVSLNLQEEEMLLLGSEEVVVDDDMSIHANEDDLLMTPPDKIDITPNTTYNTEIITETLTSTSNNTSSHTTISNTLFTETNPNIPHINTQPTTNWPPLPTLTP